MADAVLAGRSVFFTGCAGTGKSYLLNYLRQQFAFEAGTFVTASTGLAGGFVLLWLSSLLLLLCTFPSISFVRFVCV